MKIEKSYKVKKKNIIGVVEEAGIINWRIMVKTPSGTGAIQVDKDKEIVKEEFKVEYR